MSMSSGAAVATWFADLPLSDPRCNNDSCIAFYDGHTASQAQISWASQFRYGYYTAWFYSIIITVLVVNSFSQRFHSGHEANQMRVESPNICDKAHATLRSFTYRRPSGCLAQFCTGSSYGAIGLILFSIASTAILAFAQHPYYRLKRGFGSPPLGVRAGLMAFALIPLEIVLAGKVNMITCLTGIGHEKLNLFHRWTGYLILFLSVVHTIPFIYQPLHEGGTAQLRGQFYMAGGFEYTGVPPLGMLVGLVLFSMPPIRRRFYELFVNLHWLFAIIFFGLCFWHAGQELDSWTYLWVTLAFWLSSILARWFYMMSLFRTGNDWLLEYSANATKLPCGMIRLEVRVPGTWNWEPGQHAFLRIARLGVLENHPFTIANMPRIEEAGFTTMKFLIKGQRGLTGGLASLVDAQNKVFMSIDGPYGTIICPKGKMRFNNIILVAGGGGISGLLPWLEYLSLKPNEKSNNTSITLIWAAKCKDCISWVEDELQDIKKMATNLIRYNIWITDGPSPVLQVRNLAKDEETRITSKEEITSYPRNESSFIDELKFDGRPNLGAILPTLIQRGSNLVLGCGPESMRISLANAVALAQRKVTLGEAKDIRLHTETFSW